MKLYNISFLLKFIIIEEKPFSVSLFIMRTENESREKMDHDDYKKKLQEAITEATNRIFELWELLDQSQKPSQRTLEFSQSVDELIRREFGNIEGEVEVKKNIEKRVRTRKDLGEIIIGNTVIKKIKIIDDYIGYAKPLKSVAYYQILPEMDAEKPLVRILRWIVSHHPCWLVWFTSPIIKGSKNRTNGEYIVVYSLTEKESEDYNLLQKLSHFPCFCTSRGIDILLSFKNLRETVTLVEKFLHVIIERDLYGDPEFLQFLRNYEQKEIRHLLEK